VLFPELYAPKTVRPAVAAAGDGRCAALTSSLQHGANRCAPPDEARRDDQRNYRVIRTCLKVEAVEFGRRGRNHRKCGNLV